MSSIYSILLLCYDYEGMWISDVPVIFTSLICLMLFPSVCLPLVPMKERDQICYSFPFPFVIISSPLPPCHLSVGPTPDSAPVLMFTAKWPGCWLLFSFVCFTQRPFNQGRSVEDLAPITATTWEAWPRPRSVKSEQLLFLFCPFLRISSHSRRHSSSCIK